jgi:hypothetical protein
LRFGLLTEAVQAHVRSAGDAQIDLMTGRMLTAQTLEDALGPLSAAGNFPAGPTATALARLSPP